MQNNDVVVIRFSTEFEEELHRLSKRFRNIKSDIQSVITRLQEGEILGDRIARICEEWVIYKVRVRNSNIQKGKSAGYRIIYQAVSLKSIVLLTIYSKSDREDIGINEIRELLSEFYPDEG
ncbi:type II toxin-antitoxin system RelE/ParE family toxin [Scytonema sp. NUACC26]|uniref:type II toxin-antitoxin system RelE/ParE family toxin n=1 Tax=Scytonema sp. NUACC26 TaxID=3140176 RepID=UPI0034DBB6A8